MSFFTIELEIECKYNLIFYFQIIINIALHYHILFFHFDNLNVSLYLIIFFQSFPKDIFRKLKTYLFLLKISMQNVFF